ncbi:MAG TPA: M55 family metallopeptidase [Streptosporangiaceae bacterium]|nr:M55 family metallopeptidase [Streptosporangiaceae bacterium]
MRVLISADMEGVTGVTCPDDVRPGSPRWEYFRAFLTGDVNAAAAGFFESGATEVIVNEAHANKRNLLIDRLDPRCVAIVGTHKAFGMMEGIDGGVGAVAFVGYHAGAGQQGVLSHTYLGTTILDVRINGEQASEGRMNALLAAEFGVPVVLVTGDDLTCADAARWAPGAKRVAVKQCVDRYTAACLPPARTAGLIQQAAAAGLRSLAAPDDWPGGPFTYEVVFDAEQAVAACTAIPGVERTAPRSVGFTLPTMAQAIRCFRAVTVLASASVEQGYG